MWCEIMKDKKMISRVVISKNILQIYPQPELKVILGVMTFYLYGRADCYNIELNILWVKQIVNIKNAVLFYNFTLNSIVTNSS